MATGYVKIEINAQPDLDTLPSPHTVLSGDIFSPRGITSPVDISSLQHDLLHRVNSAQNKFKLPKFTLIIFFKYTERWTARFYVSFVFDLPKEN